MIIKTEIFSIISIVILFISSGCHKLCTPNYYNFAINNTIFYPELDSITIGDTLFFKSATPTDLINLSDGKQIDYSNSPNFGSIIVFTELIGINQSNDAVGDFTIIPIKGKIYTDSSAPSPGRVKQAIYAEENGEYILSFALISKKKGIYCLSTGDMPDVVKHCDRATILMNITDTNSHLHYLKDIYYGGGIVNHLDSTHNYCVKVY